MKKTVLILVVTVLVIGAATGLAFAFTGSEETTDMDIANDTEPNNTEEAIDAEETDMEETNINDGDYLDVNIDDIILPDWGIMDEAGTPHYLSVTGNVVSIEEIDDTIQLTIEDVNGNPSILILDSETVFPFENEVVEGDTVTGWYVANAPMTMIWPPRYNIAVLAVYAPEGVNIKVDRFNTWADSEEGFMLSQDETFAFRMDEDTEVILANGDDFTGGDIEGRRIVVIYGMSTRSIPEMATASKIIVLYESIMPLGW